MMVDGFGQKVRRPGLKGVISHREFVAGGHYDDWDIDQSWNAAYSAREFYSVEIGKLIVSEYEVGFVILQPRQCHQRFFDYVRHNGVVDAQHQLFEYKPASELVVDDEYVGQCGTLEKVA